MVAKWKIWGVKIPCLTPGKFPGHIWPPVVFSGSPEVLQGVKYDFSRCSQNGKFLSLWLDVQKLKGCHLQGASPPDRGYLPLVSAGARLLRSPSAPTFTLSHSFRRHWMQSQHVMQCSAIICNAMQRVSRKQTKALISGSFYKTSSSPNSLLL